MVAKYRGGASMLERLIDIAVHRRVLTLVATAGFIFFGIITFSKLKI